MSDIYSILQSSYATASFSPPSNTPYVNVDPAAYQGTWSGTYSNNQKFSIQVSNVNGFRAQVKYQSGATVSYQNVLIKDSSFRIGDTKFTLAQQGKAQIRTAVTSAVDGSVSLITAMASQNG
ncbi:MAG: hypothetical protein AB1586_32035 [Pseudomonadota bacterium]